MTWPTKGPGDKGRRLAPNDVDAIVELRLAGASERNVATGVTLFGLVCAAFRFRFTQRASCARRPIGHTQITHDDTPPLYDV